MTKKSQKKQSEELQYIPIEGNNIFSTYDLGCSASLITENFELLTLYKTNNSIQFTFRREIGIENVVNEYWAGRLKINARTFFNNLKILNNRICNE